MISLNTIAAFTFLFSLATSPAVFDAVVPNFVCEVNSPYFNMNLCGIRTLVRPRTRGIPFGACDEEHPNYDESLCPKNTMERAMIMFNEMLENEKKWVFERHCQCPEMKDNENKLEKYERNTCVRRCEIYEMKKLHEELKMDFQRLSTCRLGTTSYDKDKCADDTDKLMKKHDERFKQLPND